MLKISNKYVQMTQVINIIFTNKTSSAKKIIEPI